jgi:type I restriction enzyme S subunit
VGEWLEVPFAEAIDFQEGPGIMAADFRDDGVPLIRLAGLDRGGTVLAGCNFLDPSTVQRRWAHFALREGDILLSSSASLGRIAVVGAEAEGAIPYTGIIRMRPRDERVHAPFIRYLLEASDFQRQAEIAGVGSVMRHFGPMHLRQMTVSLPPVGTQRRIAGTLGALDDKIELNRRAAASIEELARTIFEAWFVRSSKHGEPDWPEAGLDDIGQFLNGLALQKYPSNGSGSLPVIKIAQLRSGDVSGADQASLDVPAPYVVNDGDMLFSWSGSLECVMWTGGRGALNQHLFKVMPIGVPQWFLYFWIHQHLDNFRGIAAGKATTMGHIQRHHLSEARVPVPPPGLLSQADRLIAPMFDAMVHRLAENRTISRLRDLILPRLISGELELSA